MTAPAIAWLQISRGMMVAGIGVFLLLSTTGMLDGFFWIDALAYWPVALIALGVRLVFQKSRTPWAMLLSPLLVLGTLAYVARSTPRGPGGPSIDVTTSRPEGTERVRLHAGLALARLNLTARELPGDMLLTGRGEGRRLREPGVRRWGGEARIELEPEGSFGPIMVVPGPRGAWDLEISDALPLSVDLSGAFIRGKADLGSARLFRLDLEGAFNGITVRLGAPVEDVTIRVDGAFNDINLVVPPDTPVRVVEDGFLNLVSGRKEARGLTGPAYRLRVDGACNRVEVRSDGRTPRT